MLISLLGYFALGLALALPLRKLLLWLATRYGLYTPPWQYLQPYMPGRADANAPAHSANNTPVA
jgi:hypothetical protein